ncbi:GumC family protein [Anthocerotibacter panamensis]|uniref:GumC family protein n=1 Tax=Anthocerotibacter panamensis TaxID=2857077 RepID=UPI001C402D55|nr:GNVR domain-containing protein [Anthocerotibacter panamensis]
MNKVISLVKRHFWLLVGLNLGVLALTAAIAAFYPRSWTASAQFILANSTSNLDASLGPLGSLKSTGNGFSDEVSPLKIQASILTSADVLSRIWTTDPERKQFTRLDGYAKFFKVAPQEQSTILGLEVMGSSPELALKRARKLSVVYQERLNELRQDDVMARERFTRTALEQAHRDLVSAQAQLAGFKQKTGLVNIDEQTRGLIETISALTTAQTQAEAEGSAAKVRAEVLAKRLGMTGAQALKALSLGENKEYQALRQKLIEVQTALAQARGLYTDRNPRVQSLLLQRETLLGALRTQLQLAVPKAQGVDTTLGGNGGAQDGRIELILNLLQAEGVGEGLGRQANQIQKRLDELGGRLGSISTQQGQLLELERRYSIAEGVYKGMVAQVQQARVSAFNAYPNVQILDQPSVDPKPTNPKLFLIFLGGGLAAVLGSLALVLFLESYNPLFDVRDVEGMAFPILARLPNLKQAPQPQGETEVAFQRLASAVSLMDLENRRLLVTSSTVAEGKTTLTLGLALALVEFGFRVLLVDGDLRKGGLTLRLGHRARQKGAPVPVMPGLDLLPAVPQSVKVTEFVARGQFAQGLEQVQDNYDYILVDSAPLGLTGETALMAAAVQNVLFVVRPGISDRNSVQESLLQLTQQRIRVLGLALNANQRLREYYPYVRQGAQA